MCALSLQLENIVKRFGDVTALGGVSLDVQDGDFFFLLGPSGCGKTTLLKIIGGLEKPTEGRVTIMGRDVTALPANKRSTATVFQEWALFPHMNVRNNIGFGMEMQKLPRKEIKKRVDELLGLIRLEGYHDRMAFELSGGEQQRVAIARALATEPDILLLDEPLSNLDLALRQQMRIELKRLHEKIGKTFIYVTHDQTEALTMADRVVVMDKGKAVQVGSPKEIYKTPENDYVATFIGEANQFRGMVRQLTPDPVVRTDGGLSIKVSVRDEALKEGSRAIVIVRPEQIKILSEEEARGTDNQFGAVVDDIVYFGPSLRLFAHLEESQESLFFDIVADTTLANEVRRGQHLIIGSDKDFVLCYEAD